MTKTFFFTLIAVPFALVACSKEQAPSGADPTPKNAPAVSATTNAAPAASAVGSATTPAGNALAADANGALALSWKIANAGYPKVTVSLVAGDQTIPVGTLDATSDSEGDGTISACSMKNTGATSTLWCGGTPHYNYYTAKISGGSLLVTLTDGVDQDPVPEKVTEVLRRPTMATTLKATGPASPALYGECRPGYVQKGPGQPCMHQCLKSATVCKATEKCELTSVVGIDGPHKVSACVPK
jgi:hypothetical protein